MKTLLSALLFAHVAGGAVALIVFWIPALTRKGSPVHRQAGRLYVRAMSVVLATSLPLSIVSFARGNWVGGTFLLYLFVITGFALYTGLQALKSKAGPAHYITPLYRIMAWSLVVAGAGVLILGVATQTWLLAGFSFIGLSAGPNAIATIRKPPTDPKFWWYRHFGGMIGTGIAAHVAFLNFGAQRLIPGFSLGDWGMLAWFTPVVIGLVATNRLETHYRTKFGKRGAASPAIVESTAA